MYHCNMTMHLDVARVIKMFLKEIQFFIPMLSEESQRLFFESMFYIKVNL